ncbi:MAG: undecaprenyl/decaprenyl-phosphate alpha-N-acetylglucosaminyl 1-phosphate transferase [Bacteroidales bacterium]|nr:undecaprenyl/decaprenyl-phosphate alpha-N-acetylglucosaminyl 1-phosphate transferase [Bacteroidales bacterium]
MFLLFNKLDFSIPVWLIIFSATLLSFLITYFSIPVIVKISRHKGIYDIPNHRKIHDKATPLLGGLAVFCGLALYCVIFCPENGYRELVYLLGGLIAIMTLGLKDDILVIEPKKKLAGLFLAAGIIVILGDIRITDFHGIFGISQIGYIASVVFSVLLIVFFIVSFNFIDGVDGLAAALGCIGALFYGIWFLLKGNTLMAVISLSTVSSLAAFIRFNVFSTDNKIFLGDTGAMITGFISAVLTIKFLEGQASDTAGIRISWAPFLSGGLYFVLFVDAIRVLINRLIEGHPFNSGKNHIHHILLERGLTQNSTVVLIITMNILIILALYLLRNSSPTFLLIYSVIFAFIISITVELIRKGNQKRNQEGLSEKEIRE